jgi:hypothetical protein
MHNFILLAIIAILVILYGCKYCNERFTNYWVDSDIAMRSPDPLFFEYIGLLQDKRLMTPVDYYLENKTWEDQGIIGHRIGWDKFRPSDNYSPGYELMGWK